MSAPEALSMASGSAADMHSAEGAGLVSFKTTQICVNLSPSATAERRVKRLKKSVWASGHLHGLADNGFRAPQCWFVTLTYRGVDDWQKNHISKSLDLFRKWCYRKSIPCRYTWVAELQSRGAVHYHLLVWLPQGVRMPQWDRSYGTKSKFWPHGMSNTQKAKSGVGYLMKYLSKLGELTRFPKGLRLYGIGGLTPQARGVRSWLNLPEWVKADYGVGEVVRKKIGLLVKATGELLDPAYSVQLIPHGLIVTPLRKVSQRWHDGAYSKVNFA